MRLALKGIARPPRSVRRKLHAALLSLSGVPNASQVPGPALVTAMLFLAGGHARHLLQAHHELRGPGGLVIIILIYGVQNITMQIPH